MMILLECISNLWNIDLVKLIIYVDLVIILFFVLFIVAQKLTRKGNLKKILILLLFIFFLDVLFFWLSLESPMTYPEALSFYNTNKALINKVVSIDQRSNVLGTLSVGATCSGDWRLKIRNGPTYVYPKDETENLMKKVDSLELDKHSLEIILSVVDELKLVAIQKDEYKISFGLKSYGFDSRSQIKYCLDEECDGELLNGKYHFKNGKAIW